MPSALPKRRPTQRLKKIRRRRATPNTRHAKRGKNNNSVLKIAFVVALLNAVTRKRAHFHGLDQTVLDDETVTNAFITKNGPGEVTHDLMHVHQHTPSTLRLEGNGLDVRIDLRPLLRPVGADFLMPMDEAALERHRPSHVRRHGSEGGVDVSRIESSVSLAQQVYFWRRLIWHKQPQVLSSEQKAICL
jgi:hypothetical protein